MTNKRLILLIAGLLVGVGITTLIYQNMFQPEPKPAAEGASIEAPAGTTSSETSEPIVTAPPPTPEPLVIQDRFKELLALNQDVIGWIHIANTKIDYPVAKSQDNDFYLHRDLNKKKYYPGTIFMDFRDIGDSEDRHTILYGHNMKDGSMFGTLKKFKKKDFYEANRILTYSTLYEDIQWEIFSAYVSPATLDLIPTEFADDADFMKFITVRQSKSMYPADIQLKPTDKILTLITCSYEIDDARFVLHARKVETEPIND